MSFAETADSAFAPGARDVESDRALPSDDQVLIERARAGDRGAFRTLYERHAAPVYRFAIVPLVRDKTLAEDLLADTFVRALENLHRFSWQGKGVLPWLIRIAKNLCLDHLRRAGRNTALPPGYESYIPDPTDWNAETLVAREEIADVLRMRIDTCLEAIHPRYQRVLRMRVMDKVPRAEAAEAMGVTMGTLDVLLFRACKAFRRIYNQRYGEGPEDPLSEVP